MLVEGVIERIELGIGRDPGGASAATDPLLYHRGRYRELR
jgi:hypothetical protein